MREEAGVDVRRCSPCDITTVVMVVLQVAPLPLEEIIISASQQEAEPRQVTVS